MMEKGHCEGRILEMNLWIPEKIDVTKGWQDVVGQLL